MNRFFLKSKLHAASITDSDLYYEGSLSIDIDIMKAANIMENEQVHVYNITNGARFVTYALKAPKDSKTIGVNGACARLAAVGDKIIICTYAAVSHSELEKLQPTILFLDKDNNYTLKEALHTT